MTNSAHTQSQTLSRCGNSDPDATHRKSQPWCCKCLERFWIIKKSQKIIFQILIWRIFLASTWQLCRSKRYSSSYYDVQIPSWVDHCIPCDGCGAWVDEMQDSHVRMPLRSSGTFVLPWSSKTASPAGGATCISMGRGFVAGARYVTEKIVNAFLSGVSNSGEDEIR